MCVCWYISLDQDSVAHTKANMKKMMESLGEGKKGVAEKAAESY